LKSKPSKKPTEADVTASEIANDRSQDKRDDRKGAEFYLKCNSRQIRSADSKKH
jgi:hypothetical protein